MFGDKLNEECGVFGIYNLGATGNDLAINAYLGLMALQHRGQEACGIAVNLNRKISFHKGVGQVDENFNVDVLAKMEGSMAVGHCRYSRTGARKDKDAAQPLVINYAKGQLAICHNGSIANAAALRDEYSQFGAIYRSYTDTEVIAYTLARLRLSEGSVERAVLKAMSILKGAYSLVVMSPSKMIVARDPRGFRPLCFGLKKDGSYVFASETCALDAVDAEFVRDVRPGEVIVVKDGIMESIDEKCGQYPSSLCIFEYIYFARPDSIIHGQFVNDSRRLAGRLLARNHPVQADIVFGVPDSGLASAWGYSEESGIPYEEGFGKNRYAGRTFIRPDQMSREAAVRLKLNPMKKYVYGKKVIMVDDSIVRGTTTSINVKMLREAGAAEVHVRMASPPFRHPCFYGTDVPSSNQLICATHSIDEVTKIIGADSLAFLDINDLIKIIPDAHDIGYCHACFSGIYPD
ncbi:MAG: amidophosphoribosyltransferase [Clostridiales bacterium]|jgi:amidophosphoribosyltransferase|nr:amidophosphoribosyltransferase [Clostridiales bacterium]